MKCSTNKLTVPAFMALALVVSVVPALAGVRPDDRAGARGIGAAATSSTVRPDNRPGVRGVGAARSSVVMHRNGELAARPLRPDDRAGLRGIGDAPETIALDVQQALSRPNDAFDWAAAGLGAATGAAVMSFLAWALLLRRTHSRAGTLA